MKTEDLELYDQLHKAKLNLYLAKRDLQDFRRNNAVKMPSRLFEAACRTRKLTISELEFRVETLEEKIRG